jgi:hypothetical protein
LAILIAKVWFDVQAISYLNKQTDIDYYESIGVGSQQPVVVLQQVLTKGDESNALISLFIFYRYIGRT